MLHRVPPPEVGHYVIIGSYALGTRPCNDLDIVCMSNEFTQTFSHTDFLGSKDGIEYHLADKMNMLKVLLSIYPTGTLVPPEHLLWIKGGHLHIPHFFHKHMADFNVLRKITGQDKKLYPETLRKIRMYRHDVERHTPTHTMKVSGPKNKFFDDAVTKYVEHDWIHEQVAHKEKPMYTYMQIDDSVKCHKDLWETFSYTEKVNTVQEEAMVIGLERWIIPAIKKNQRPISCRAAFIQGMEKVCTTLSSGWFRDLAHYNYITIVSTINLDKMEATINKL